MVLARLDHEHVPGDERVAGAVDLHRALALQDHEDLGIVVDVAVGAAGTVVRVRALARLLVAHASLADVLAGYDPLHEVPLADVGKLAQPVAPHEIVTPRS